MQDRAVTIDVAAPLQSTESTEYVAPSLYLTVIMYAVISAPLIVGFVQLIVTLSGANVVEGIDGSEGIEAAKTVAAADIDPYPNAFLA